MQYAEINHKDLKKITTEDLQDMFWDKKDYEVRIGTDDWIVGENQPIDNIYIDHISKQIVLVCHAEL